jgi:hypothetical protein
MEKEIRPIQFTESQIEMIDMARRQSYDNGMTHGIILGIGAVSATVLVSSFISKYWHLLL